MIGDVIGRPGRDVLAAELLPLRERLRLDFVIANGENAAGGFGLTRSVADDLFATGVDVLTTGNHWLDQKDILDFIDEEDRILRPLNYPKGTPGRGAGLYHTRAGDRVLVMNAMGRIYMDPLDDPFAAVDAELAACPLMEGATRSSSTCTPKRRRRKWRWAISATAAPASSSARTATCRRPTRKSSRCGTGYQTDAGACADYDCVIGMDKYEPLQRFTRKMSGGRMTPATGPATVCAVFVETDDRTGLAVRCEPVRIGGRLIQTAPSA